MCPSQNQVVVVEGNVLKVHPCWTSTLNSQMRLKSSSLYKFSKLLHSVGMIFTAWAWQKKPLHPLSTFFVFPVLQPYCTRGLLNIWFGFLCYCFCSYYSLCLKSSLSFSLLAYKFYLSFKTHLRFFLQFFFPLPG